MKLKKLVIAMLIVSSYSFAQDPGSINFINNLSAKKTATFGDAVKLYVLILDKRSRGFNADVNTLKSLKILKGSPFDKDKPLRRGMLSLLVARHLKLSDSLFYLIFKIERYAFRACIADDIMDYNSSEWDRMSGDELIEIMSIVSERMED